MGGGDSGYSELPEDNIVGIKTYIPSDTIIINNTPQKMGPTGPGGAYEKVKEIKIESNIGPTSLFRFKFNLYHGGTHGEVFGKIYRNGVPIGTERTNNESSPGIQYSEDIATTNWVVGDTIELWTKCTGIAGVRAYVAEFQICGVGSEFKNTMV